MSEDYKGSQGSQINIDSAVMGEVAWLMAQSDLHNDWPMSSIIQWVLPPLASGQYRLYRNGAQPFGFVSWGWLSKEKESQYAMDPSSLTPQDWSCGDRLWLLDWIAPNGGTRAITKDLRENVFHGQVARGLRWRKNSDTAHIFYLHGRGALDKARDHVSNPTVELA